MEEKKQSYQVGEARVIYDRFIPFDEMISARGSIAVRDFAVKFWNAAEMDHHESVYIIGLNSGGKILTFSKIADGGLSSSTIDVKRIFQLCFLTNSPILILVHNHPSGVLKPSIADIEITRTLQRGCQILDLRLLDHLIIRSDGEYYSFSDNDEL